MRHFWPNRSVALAAPPARPPAGPLRPGCGAALAGSVRDFSRRFGREIHLSPQRSNCPSPRLSPTASAQGPPALRVGLGHANALILLGRCAAWAPRRRRIERILRAGLPAPVRPPRPSGDTPSAGPSARRGGRGGGPPGLAPGLPPPALRRFRRRTLSRFASVSVSVSVSTAVSVSHWRRWRGGNWRGQAGRPFESDRTTMAYAEPGPALRRKAAMKGGPNRTGNWQLLAASPARHSDSESRRGLWPRRGAGPR